jgi:hypothetical protein
MDSALLVHRLHFAFTITFHYLFPQLTMGLAPLIVVLKTLALRSKDENRRELYSQAARFWARIFGINFVLGVVTGIPMEFQFGTNWSLFSRFAGGVIGQTLAMEGVFAFFLESSFLGLFLYGEKRLSPRAHWWSAVAVFLGSWLSGFFIIATDAWMQHPVGYAFNAKGAVELTSFWQLVLNPWAWWQYAHNMSGAAITGSFVMASVGAFYLLGGKYREHAKIFVRVGVVAGCGFSILQLFPTGDGQGRMIARNQPVTLAAMEALFASQPGAPLVLLGQPERVDLPTMEGRGARPRRLSFQRVARQYPAALLQLPHHGGARDGLHCHHGGVGVSASTRKAVRGALDVVDFAVEPSVPLHRQHRRLDDGGARSPALAGVWIDAHRRWLFEAGLGRQRHVHPARFHGDVPGDGGLVLVLDPSRNCAGPGRGFGSCALKR